MVITTTNDRIPYRAWKRHGHFCLPFVEDFSDGLFDLMFSAVSASRLVDDWRSMLDDLEPAIADAATRERLRADVERAASIAATMYAEATAVSHVMSEYLRICAFDFDGDLSGCFVKVGRADTRIDRSWSRLLKLTTPAARHAVGLAVLALTVEAHARRTKTRNTALLSHDVAMNVLDTAGQMFELDHCSINRTDTMKIVSGRTLLDALAGVIVHLSTASPAMLTITTKRLPELCVQLTVQRDDTALIELVGQVPADRTAAMADLGFNAPTRRRGERNWRRSFESATPIEIPLAIAGLLEQVLRLPLNATITLATHTV